MGKWTPGPWSVEGGEHRRLVIRSGMTPLAEMWLVGQPESERRANAYVIAAAPDLLEACKVASALLKGLPRSMGYDFDARQLDAAIAKATQP